MKSIVYGVYQNGAAGLSNLIMSIELGVVIATLTDRVLILKNNTTPIANVVQYDGIVHNTYPSRITDLIDLGVPWMDWDEAFGAHHAAQDICNVPPWDSVFYFPPHLPTNTDDFRSFAKGRSRFITIDDDLQRIPALAFSGGENALMLGYYSSFFYLGRSAQLQALDALRKMKPKPEIAAFAARVAGELGAFNAVHIRRGDFKKTVGVTTLERKPSEAIEALDHHFGRDEPLVILTDEPDDPFFDDIKTAFRQHIILDHYILQNHGAEFHDLPTHDSIALAYISQLVASQSKDFIGTMTSTFTALIQRMRGNLGKEELFKYLWNELPPVGAKLEPGRHEIGDDIKLEKGVMVEDGTGPYSWNRVNQRLNVAWMREWPESFLNEAEMLERAKGRELVRSSGDSDTARHGKSGLAGDGAYPVSFLGSTVKVSSDDAGITRSVMNLFALMAGKSDATALGEVRYEVADQPARLMVDGDVVGKSSGGAKLLRRGYREVVRLFIDEHPELVWIHAASAASNGGAIILPGSWGRGKSSLVLELHQNGWLFLSDDIVPLDPVAGQAIPFPGTPQVRSGTRKALSRDQLGTLPKSAVALPADSVAHVPQRVSSIVFPYFTPDADATLSPISPGQAVGELLENCLSFPNNDDKTIQTLCDMVEDMPVHSLHYSNVTEAAQLLIETHASLIHVN